MRRTFLYGSVLALGCLAITPAAAQVPLVPGALSIGGGIELPRDEAERIFDRGVTAQAAYRLGIPLTPFAIRAEGEWSRFEAGAGTTVAGQALRASGTTQILTGGGAVEMTVLPLIFLRGYVIAGASYARTTGDFAIGAATVRAREESGLGYSAGVGVELRLPFLPAAGVEARYRVTPKGLGGVADLRSIPITARLTF